MTTRKIAVFTGTRAEYGLLYWLMKDIKSDPDLVLQVLVSGAHLSPDFGLTYRDIEKDGFDIEEKVEIVLSSDSAVGTAKSLGLGVLGFADALSRMSPDALVVLGDRYEALAVAQTAAVLRIPVVHLHGGEITEGAYDDAFRHAITKLSTLHCTSTEVYRARVIQMGEMPDHVFNFGAIGLDHLKRSTFMTVPELSESLNFQLKGPYFLATYHPATLATEDPEQTVMAMLAALDHFSDHQVIITFPNADDGRYGIMKLIQDYASRSPGRVLAMHSLGQARYLSAVRHAAVVVGNSSSGIIEVPSFDVPSVNIGRRQLGRLAAKSVIHCATSYDEIVEAISLGISGGYKQAGETVVNPYGAGDVSPQIVALLKSHDFKAQKSFYDLPVSGSDYYSN
ncbi:UDP-N-acetylglucosamine 2-epimerase [uncultured Sulfitobacter sp.]|uniref:UDP-N-acetylglucosamine 2-epimerase n=1 Tax=uncultured Sulfitobacter sp. TaxID=191468 RepID=UPI0030D8DEB6|tara:strand:+ start:52940 stop:54124 length:1185 start_codon:yes stop_codon:yes gene_type:complete